jgi:hypothetical protein
MSSVCLSIGKNVYSLRDALFVSLDDKIGSTWDLQMKAVAKDVEVR